MNQNSHKLETFDTALAQAMHDSANQDNLSVIAKLSDNYTLPKGIRVISRFADIATLRVPPNMLSALTDCTSINAIEASRNLRQASDYNVIDPLTHQHDNFYNTYIDATEIYTRRPAGVSATGRGCVVGILDWGMDFAFPSFRHNDGSSRLLALWDQRDAAVNQKNNRWGYGRILTRKNINRALLANDPYEALDYHPADADSRSRYTESWQGAHGTHVSDIAAGNGLGGGMPGVAPEADIIFVHLSRTTKVLGGGNLGDSASVLEAIDFIFSTAGNRPCVINMSVGAHGGPHDGSTLVEQGIDRAVWHSKGRAVVNSAGNYFESRAHTEGRINEGSEDKLRFYVPASDPTPSELEVYYEDSDIFKASVIDPAGKLIAHVSPGEKATLTSNGLEVGSIYHFNRRAESGNRHIDLFLKPNAPAGKWSLLLKANKSLDGRYHAWIERDSGLQPKFIGSDNITSSTTGTLCNGKFSITVGAYNPYIDDKPIGSFSSSGPTIDGRIKPELVAPGVEISAARSTPPSESPAARYTSKNGTSMAAPHVAGTIALMFEAAGRPIGITDTRALLFSSIKKNDFLSNKHSVSDLHRLGYGYLDIAAAEHAARIWGHDHSINTESSSITDGLTTFKGRKKMNYDNDKCSAPDNLRSQDSFSHYDMQDDQFSDASEYAENYDNDAFTENHYSDSYQDLSLQDNMYDDDQYDGQYDHQYDNINDEMHPVVNAGEFPGSVLSAGDQLLRTTPYEGLNHSSVVTSNNIESASSLIAQGIDVESTRPGGYVKVMETSPDSGAPHTIGRRITDSWGRLLPGQTLLRGQGHTPIHNRQFNPGNFQAKPRFDDAVTHESHQQFSDISVANIKWCYLRKRIVIMARREEMLWTKLDGTKHEESNHPDRISILTEYWKATGMSAANARAQAQVSANNARGGPWSAAFISYVMKKSGVERQHGFEFSAGHIRYIVGALRNRERSDQNRPFWLVDSTELLNEASPEPGDIICFNRCARHPNPRGCTDPNSRMTSHSYDSLRTSYWHNGTRQNVQPNGFSHTSLVVGNVTRNGRRFLETIGGNESNTVKSRTQIEINQHGNIINPAGRNIFGMIKIMKC